MTCAFCNKEGKIGDRIIESDNQWYAFVPGDPEIFGHVLVTTDAKHIREICKAKEGDQEILNSMMAGVRIMSNKLKNIKKVDRVYVAMAGETPTVHIHFHLFPRYGFLNDTEIAKWAEKYEMSKGKIEWRKFYANPTKNFEFHDGLGYLGEIERTYNEMKKRVCHKPPDELVDEMAEKLRRCIE